VACIGTAIVASVLATWSRRARYVGRIAVGILMLLGGAVSNAVNLALGGDYAGFADRAHFGWVTTAWRAVVAPNQLPAIGLLVAFEAVVGVLILSGGPRTQLGPVGAIGFHAASGCWLGRDHLLRSHDSCVGVAAPRGTVRCRCFCHDRRSGACVPADVTSQKG
jgi:hypothetical protein